MNSRYPLRACGSKKGGRLCGAVPIFRLGLLSLAGLMASPIALAQGGTDEADDALEEVVVTGSRIISSNLTSPIPTQVIDVGEIQESGTVDLGEVIEELPGVFLGISPSNSLLSTQNSGLSTVDLRGLGTTRTLTLIDGRRVVSNSGSAPRVDTATIPTGFIERVDITTGGASAVYGSDAIAGVANIILKSDFEGFEMDARFEDSDEGGREASSINATWGMNFAGARGNVMIGAGWEEKEALFATQRRYAASNLEIDLDTGELEPNLSSTMDGGRFDNGDAWNNGGVWQNDQADPNPIDGQVYCLDDGRVPACDDYQEALDGWDFRPFSMLFPYRERWSALVKGNYDLTDRLTASAMFHYSETDTRSSRAPASINDAHTFGPFDDPTRIGNIEPLVETAPGSGVFEDNPFIHPAVRHTLTDDTLDWRRRTMEVGERDRTSNRATTRFSLGLDGELGDNWSFTAYVGRGVFEQNQVKNNEINRQNVQFALNIVGDPDNPGQYRCIDDAAVAAGCVPLNIFGVGSITPEAADYIRHNITAFQELTQTAASFVVSGDLWELPAGMVEVAAGIDYRKEEQFLTGDPITNAGLTTSSSLLDVDADFDVTEAFVEFGVPLIFDKPGIAALDVSTAYRYADYNTIGDVASWNFGVSYAPVESFRIRAQISQAQRAPNITELFSPLRSDFDGFRDPCDNVTATTTGVVADNCRSEPGIAAAIAEDGIFEQSGSSIFGPNQGNIDLFEETADTTTYGFVFTPSAFEGFSLIADYYRIKVEDVIDSVDSQLAGELCYFDDQTFATNRFCDSITRDSDGQVSRIINQVENLNRLTSEGIDVTLAYDFAVPGVPGDFKSKLLYTHVLKNETSFDGPMGEEIDDAAGEVGLPEHEYRLTLRWRPMSNLSFRYRLRYQGTVLDDNRAEPGTFAYKRFEAVQVHDIYASYTFERDHRYRIYAGINNIENQNGPYLPDGYVHGDNSNVNSSYDRVGRRFYVGLRFDW